MTRNNFALVFLALAALFGACRAAITFKADYTMRNKYAFPNGYMTGTLYYHYVPADPISCRLRFDTTYYDTAGQSHIHSELYHYGNGGVYSICSACDAAMLDAQLELWQMLQTDTCSEESGGYYRCVRDMTTGSFRVSQIVTKGDPTDPNSGFSIKYINFTSGRELFIDGDVEMINYNDYLSKFELDPNDDCPEPVCRSYVDVVFVLDASGSVNKTEWKQVKAFLKKAAVHFNLGPYDAMVSVVEFSAPTTRCCKKYPKCNGKWELWNVTCCFDPDLNLTKVTKPTRFIDDCVFDLRCDNVTGNTSKIMFNLTYSDVENNVAKLQRITGGTCQRYGLMKAYDILFGNFNTRCPNQGDRSTCPVPVVIVVTDGADYCHTSTIEWAEKIKKRDPRGLLLEVGVGFTSNFDKQFIQNLSSTLVGYDTALNVDNYAKIESVLEKMVKPVCSIGQSTGGSCGASCRGYCACGDCFCPHCLPEASTICKEYVCSNLSAENGCKERDVFCNVPTDDPQCYNQTCDPTVDDPADKCKAVPKDCRKILGLKTCQTLDCVGGCDISRVRLNNSFCLNDIQENCMVGVCDPDAEGSDPVTGCIAIPKNCSTVGWAGLCDSVECNVTTGQCEGTNCLTDCFGTDYVTPKCKDELCWNVECNVSAEDDNERCIRTPFECPVHPNNCLNYTCGPDKQNRSSCIEIDLDKLNCAQYNKPGGCRSYYCDPEADNGQGACVSKLTSHEVDICAVFTCGEDGYWDKSPQCPQTKACKLARCNDDDGSCYEVDADCRGKVKLPNKCFQHACREPDGCYKKQFRGAHFDVCGNCIRPDDLEDSDSYSYSSEEWHECTLTSEEDLPTEGLAAAAVALIVIGAILIGGTIMLTGFMGTQALIERARGASNQTAVSNPLFEDSKKELSNPVYEETEDQE